MALKTIKTHGVSEASGGRKQHEAVSYKTSGRGKLCYVKRDHILDAACLKKKKSICRFLDFTMLWRDEAFLKGMGSMLQTAGSLKSQVQVPAGLILCLILKLDK